MGAEYKGDKQYCSWCGVKTLMEPMQLPQIPILEFMEEKINKLGRDKVWGEHANWANLKIDPDIEAELLVYDEMLSTVELKVVCEKCLNEDDRLYEKYYGGKDEWEIRFDMDF